ncbi:C-C chemokine receptor type 6a [Esox lucius]|uniref:G-protein coupled receptors family 1 profile domain-containing protein n=1 Tax=Esox lucius TaxID=8010 RepID=A0AAY5KGY0_ESOLU|nr:C-C chemokine receptor type 6a [Esox lucius]
MENDTTSDYQYDDIQYVMPCEMTNSDMVERSLRFYIHSVICILGFIGNILVIITYAFYKKTKSMTDVYLLNMAIADMIFVVALPLIIYNEYNHWDMGAVACKILRGAYSVNLYSGMLLLACISTDRYIAIVLARRSFRLRSRILLYGRIVCATVWSLALFLSIPTVIYYDRYVPSNDFVGLPDYENNSLIPDESSETDVVCDFKFSDSATAHKMKTLVPSTQLAVGFFLPLLVMGFCYTAVIITLLRANFQKHKAVRVVLAVVAVFIACHLPYNVTLLYNTIVLFKTKLCGEVDTTQLAKTVTETVAYLHCCLNPLLYGFIGVRFRNHFRKIIADLWCMGKRVLNNRGFSRATSEFYISNNRRSVDGYSNENASSFTM